MMMLRPGLIAVVVALAVVVFATDTTHLDPSGFQYREFSLVRPLLSSGMAIPFWEFMGNSVVTDDYVRLTPDRQSKRGAMWSTKQSHLSEWEMTIEFKVHGQGRHLFGDGFAFWYTAERGHLGPIFGNKDKFVGLGIFFDTYNNHPHANQHGHPYISALVNDGSISYDHDSDGTHSQVSGCQSYFRNVDHHTYARIIYRGKTLKVLTDTEDDGEWETCFVVSDVYLPTGYYFGFSAATGELADNHDIVSVKTSDPAPLTEEEAEEERQLKTREIFISDEHQAEQEQEDGEDEDEQEQEQQRQTAAAAAAAARNMQKNRKDQNAKKKPFAKFHQKPRAHKNDGEEEEEDEEEGGSSFWLIFVIIILLVGGGVGAFFYTKMQKAKASRFSF